MGRRTWPRTAFSAFIVAVMTWVSPAAEPFDSGRIPFTVRFGGEEIFHRTMAVFVLPEEVIDMGVVEDSGAAFTAYAEAGHLSDAGPNRWTWTAPAESGPTVLSVCSEPEGEAAVLRAFVLMPLNEVKRGSINGYEIGKYPRKRHRGLAIYDPPAGLVEVTPEMLSVPVSPHFRLGQFLSRQDGGPPQYLALRMPFLTKLELILERINDRGIRCDTLTILSGYRTPHYNGKSGGGTYSRHCWGDAADVIVDASPQDGVMDDLNKDGRVTPKDAEFLYDLIDALMGEPGMEPYAGGLERYRKTRTHGPYVHVDARGHRARW